MEKADSEVQTKFLKKLVYHVVDTYVVKEQNINAHIEALENETRIDIGLLPNGCFACQYPGCKKNFAFDGKRCIAHLMGLHGMLFLNFSDTITEGDRLRILRC